MNRPFFMLLIGIRREEVDEAVLRLSQEFDLASKTIVKNKNAPKLANVHLMARLKSKEEDE